MLVDGACSWCETVTSERLGTGFDNELIRKARCYIWTVKVINVVEYHVLLSSSSSLGRKMQEHSV